MKFCPRCASPLAPTIEGGRPRPSCPAAGCGFVDYGDHSIGAGAVVLRDDRILLIERRSGARSWWQIPGGYVEVGEEIHAAIEREVLEETGVAARVVDVVGFRHSAGTEAERPANIYVVFRLRAECGEPRPDGEESFSAGFFDSSEISRMTGLSPESRWAVEKVLSANGARGLIRDDVSQGSRRPGNALFGLLPESPRASSGPPATRDTR